MSGTRIIDVVTPENWRQYGANNVVEQNAFISSGVMTRLEGIEIPKGGNTIQLPFWNDLGGDAENLTEGALTPDKITAGKHTAISYGRGKAWAATDLSALMAGSDPAMAILKRLSAWWTRQDQRELLAVAAGALAGEGMEGHVLDGSTKLFDGAMLVDGTQLLGDAKGSLTAIVMHSATEAALAKQKLITYETVDGKTDRVPFYMGKRVIVDDVMHFTGGVYTSYLFGASAFGYSERSLGDETVETDRDILVAENYIAMRKQAIIHPYGLGWKGEWAGVFPSRAELADGAHWKRVADTKAIPIVAIKHKVVA